MPLLYRPAYLTARCSTPFSGGGNCGSIVSRVSRKMRLIWRLRCHLWSAATTCQGAYSVLHSVRTVSYARWYWFQYSRSLASALENFHRFCGSSSRDWSRFFCSCLLM